MASINADKPPPVLNKKARAKLAKDTINILIPHILKTNERARNGVSASQLIRYDPSLAPKRPEQAIQQPAAAQTPPQDPAQSRQAPPSPPSTPPQIRILKSDTLDAAHALLSASAGAQKRRIAVLNMASPLRPGGGVLNGAVAQEESLCTRSTLFASLRDEWYRLPEDAVAWSPDVCVFRGSGGAGELAKAAWWYVDVVSCAAVRFPETVEREGLAGRERAYADEGQREAMVRRVRTVVQAAVAGGVTHLVLGALGCGAYGNPPGEVARVFRKVICGDRRRRGLSVEESGIEEIVFAIFDDGVNLSTFREVFKDVARNDEGA